MDLLLTLAMVAVVIVLIFDHTNGFHDASNIIATVIASRAMTPVQAVINVAVFEFLGPLLGGTAVANTIGKFILVGDLQVIASVIIILCGIVGAIVWNLGTWWFGIPSSSSHALVGGLAGAVVEMFKRRELYRHLSNGTDRMARAAYILHDIVVKIS
jgi:PiT family inorganic phosphate transporter